MQTLILDMYGVIIEESKGNFIPYTFSYFPESEHERLTKLFKEEQLFTQAGNGEIDSFEFLSRLGFPDPDFHMRDYIENHLTLDQTFHDFANEISKHFSLALLSNDVSAWSKHITAYHNLDPYFSHKIVSADVRCRKPETKIYELALKKMGVAADSCVFVDNSSNNLRCAAALGMKTVLFNRDNEAYEGNIVNSFDELKQALCG